MSDDFEPIGLARPDIGEREEELALEVLRSGRLSLGPMGQRFERAFADFLGVDRRGRGVERHGRRSTSACAMLGWGPGDEVITSPFTFVASANCAPLRGGEAGLRRRRSR